MPTRQRASIGGYAALHFAAGYGHTGMFDLLVEAGADPATPADDGATPLHFAALYGRLKAIEQILGYGIDPDSVDGHGVRPVQYARIRLQMKAVRLLLAAGARPDDIFDAVNAGDTAYIQALLAAGADINASDLFGTPLHRAAASGQVYVANMLIDNGANLESIGDPAQFRPLHIAAMNNDTAMIELLIDRGATVDSLDGWGRTALIEAISTAYGVVAAGDHQNKIL